MTYQDEVRAIIEEFRDKSNEVIDDVMRELYRRRAEVLDFLVNHEIPRLEMRVKELEEEIEGLKRLRGKPGPDEAVEV